MAVVKYFRILGSVTFASLVITFLFTNNYSLSKKTSLRNPAPQHQKEVILHPCNGSYAEGANFTYEACPQSFRPSLASVLSKLYEIPMSDEKSLGEPPDFYRLRDHVVTQLAADYVISPEVCGRRQPFLLVMVMSVLGESQARGVVRATWASAATEQAWPHRRINSRVGVVFVVGNEDEAGVGSRENVTSEAEAHGDVLFLNMSDTYRNLTLKVLSSLRWAKDACPGVKFVAKVDMDTFVNVPLLVDTLMAAEVRLNFSILGYVYVRRTSLVFREGQWAVSQSLYPMERYPEYASGCAYVISRGALSKIVDAAPFFPMLPVEDVFLTGVMRYVTGCRLFSLNSHLTHRLDVSWASCAVYADQKIAGTGCKEERLRTVWQMFQKGDGQCR
ncbi:Beta-1,3-galactosyltransferase 4 [Bulinus truncatus]|nr:Beta-1,3-galactosyltransferase 4 [Bulinus truncatus]